MIVNKKRGYATVRLGDGEKFLRYDMNVLAEVEDMLGVSVLDLFSDESRLKQRIGFKMLRALVWAGVSGAGGTFDLNTIGEMMDVSRLDHYFTQVGLALEAALGQGKSGKEVPEHLGPTSSGTDQDPGTGTS